MDVPLFDAPKWPVPANVEKADLIQVDLTGAHMRPINRIENSLVYCASSHDVSTVVCDGKIVMEFNFKPSQPGAQWYASELELVAPVERIAALAGALAGTFPVADTLAWIEPDTGTSAPGVSASRSPSLTRSPRSSISRTSSSANSGLPPVRSARARSTPAGSRAPGTLARR
jgi:hypothetical protein